MSENDGQKPPQNRSRKEEQTPKPPAPESVSLLKGNRPARILLCDDEPCIRDCMRIIFDWTFDGPVNRITQNKDTIVIEYGQMNLKRTVYMNQKTHPANVKLTRAGHSIGKWENDVLVVDTVGFLPGTLTGATPHSDKLHVVERFSLDPEKMALTRSYAAEDPVYLKGKYTGSDTILVADAPYNPGKCRELNFIDYSKQQKQ